MKTPKGIQQAFRHLGEWAFSAFLLLPFPLAAEDARSVEILRYGCGNELGRREVTLFQNGTVRLREGPWDEEKLLLTELSPEALEDNLRILRGVYSDSALDKIREPLLEGPAGSFTERCEVYLGLPELQEPLLFRFSSYDIPPLRISRIVHLAEGLAAQTHPASRGERLPEAYEPQFGDILKTREGERYQVLRKTTDGRGVELQGVDQPLRLFVVLEDLDDVFVALEKRPGVGWWRQ